MIVFEIFGLLFLIAFFTFPMWIHNWKHLFNRELQRKTKEYLKNCKKVQIPIIKLNYTKNCTQEQPFKINDQMSIICNFPCDGICKLKGNEKILESKS